MNNNVENIKDKIVFKYSVLLAVVWLVASCWLNIDLLIDVILGGWQSIYAGILLLLVLPAYLISFFMKKYNNLYVRCKMNVRKESVVRGIITGVIIYAGLILLFYFIFNIHAIGIYSTAGIVTGCTSAYSHLKKHCNTEDKK